MEGIKMGIVWFTMNIMADFIILLPMSGMEIGPYFAGIDLR